MIDNNVLHPRAGAMRAPSSQSAVSWGAIPAGATAAAALSLALLVLGTGLGLSAVSPWTDRGGSASAFAIGTIAWVTLTQLAAAGMRGYLAGRLRTRWAATQGDEVYFRDPAHGFLAWALATLVTAGLLTSTIGNIVGSGARAGATMAGTAATSVAATVVPAASAAAEPGGGNADTSRYFVDTLFKSRGSSPARLPAARCHPRTRQAADTARKASATGASWLFVSLLIGAFCASLPAAWGGRDRDRGRV